MTRATERLASARTRVTEALLELNGAILDLADASSRAPDADNIDRLMTVSEAGAALGISRTTAYQLIQTGRLRSFKIRGRRLVAESALRELIDAARRSP